MENNYITRLEEENAALRKSINTLEDDNALCNMWKPRWRDTVAGMELVIGKDSVIGEVAQHPTTEKWWVYVLGKCLTITSKTREEAKKYLIKTIMEGNNDG